MYASQGKRVGVVDADIQSPGVHILFGLAGSQMTTTVNDYLWGDLAITEAAVDVTATAGPDVPGRIFLIPASTDPGQISRALRDGYDAHRFTDGVRSLVDDLELDLLLIDTHPGLNEETLLSIVISHLVVIVLRPDHQDYEGTGIAVEVARQLEVPDIRLIVNKAPKTLDPTALAEQVTLAYAARTIGVVPHSDELMGLASEGLFVERHPDHEVTGLYRDIAAALVE